MPAGVSLAYERRQKEREKDDRQAVLAPEPAHAQPCVRPTMTYSPSPATMTNA
jgi:hypothetical protein